MNRFGFCKQEGPVFRIRDLNSPWRSVLHLGQRQMVGKSYQWEDDPETSTFSFLEKGRVRLLNLSETGKERIVLYIEPGCLFREIVLLHVSPSHPASLVALDAKGFYGAKDSSGKKGYSDTEVFGRLSERNERKFHIRLCDR